MSCDGWSLRDKATVSSSFNPLVVKNYTPRISRRNLQTDNNVTFPIDLKLDVSEIYNEGSDHYMIVKYTSVSGPKYALLNHQQIHQIRRSGFAR